MSGKASLVVALIFLSVYSVAGMRGYRNSGSSNDIGQLFRNKLDAKANLVNAYVALGKGLARPVIQLKSNLIKPIIGVGAAGFALGKGLIKTKAGIFRNLARPVFGLKADGLTILRNSLDKKIKFLRGF